MSNEKPLHTLTESEINDRAVYHPPTPEAIKRHEAVRGAFTEFMKVLNEQVPPGREQALAFTNAEQAMFWGNAGIARNHSSL